MTHKANGKVARDQRRDSAAGRRGSRDERGTDGQIKALDKRLGEGVGAQKERDRLAMKEADPTTKVRKTRRGKKANS
jgi:hypothetical protein